MTCLRPIFLRIALAATALAAAAPASLAGDAATMEVIGFSADGSVFAFEEYGIQDGSGFPYASRYYIDTRTDRFLPTTPVRAVLEDETATVAQARTHARRESQMIYPDETFAGNSGHAAGRNAITELSADPFRMEINPRPVFPPIDAPLEFRLEEVPVAQPDRCQGFGEIKGFRLLRIGPAPASTERPIHADDGIPTSRGCPLGYAIGGVQTFYPQAGNPVFAVLISVRQVGFEGPNHRWIAVTGRID